MSASRRYGLGSVRSLSLSPHPPHLPTQQHPPEPAVLEQQLDECVSEVRVGVGEESLGEVGVRGCKNLEGESRGCGEGKEEGGEGGAEEREEQQGT